MTVETILTIAGNYPDTLKVLTSKNKEGKCAGFLYLMKRGEIHRLLLSSDSVFNTEKQAEKVINDAIMFSNEWVKNEDNMKPIRKFI